MASSWKSTGTRYSPSPPRPSIWPSPAGLSGWLTQHPLHHPGQPGPSSCYGL
jgi:hypothetical protein